MTFTVATVVLSALVLLDLALTFAVIRRLREHEDRFARLADRPLGGLEQGARLPPFETVDQDGTAVANATLLGRRTVIGVFSTVCPGCDAQAPAFCHVAANLASRGVTVFSLLVEHDGRRNEDLQQTLAGCTRLVVERPHGGLTTALATHSTPSYFVFDEQGRLTAKSLSPVTMPVPLSSDTAP